MEEVAPPANSRHIIMLPFMAQGHLIPFLELAIQILHHNPIFTISIVNSPLNINYLRSAISNRPSPPTQIHLISLPFHSSDHGLPPNSENTDGLAFNQIIKLFYASTALQSPFCGFISDIIAKEGTVPLCIISDSFMSWANEVARSFGTVNYTFTTCGAYGTAAYASVWLNLPHRNLADGGNHDEFSVPGFPESCRFSVMQLHPYLRAADGEDEWSRFFQHQISLSLHSDGWLCNTVEDIEAFGLEVLRNYIKLPVWCIGPLLPSKMLKGNTGSDTGLVGSRSGKRPGVEPEKCIEWLDSHPPRSVLYISFGSQNTISETQMMELARGLEESKTPFIWVIRPPIGFDPKGEFRTEWLPLGFEDRIGKQGLVVHKWAPQLEILCHRSTGAFLSHCGWNSVLESLSQGVPLIGWPLAAEQGYNVKMLVEEMGVCVVLTSGVHSRIEKEDVRRVIEVVLNRTEDGKGEVMRRKASELGERIRASVEIEKGCSYKAMKDFVSTILSRFQ
ncbi:UDP-glycosyltransferase 92A1-like [Cynara cardunculus var. scolymus]|uniref:Glycosyltransferase n=1 Tax=Cynara cardunculus var. scolymus TaxID=59895 RepID=A0A103XPX0_CYNCS|nr:UDP-glycosyltransferase 92A1-like [Cynara cardunculus var. scolymus]KVH94710.1 UDP-glucuronosyl/UDP-glucosyltransferase [Cynara cardunculus var. scolymus]